MVCFSFFHFVYLFRFITNVLANGRGDASWLHRLGCLVPFSMDDARWRHRCRRRLGNRQQVPSALVQSIRHNTQPASQPTSQPRQDKIDKIKRLFVNSLSNCFVPSYCTVRQMDQPKGLLFLSSTLLSSCLAHQSDSCLWHEGWRVVVRLETLVPSLFNVQSI